MGGISSWDGVPFSFSEKSSDDKITVICEIFIKIYAVITVNLH